MQTTTLADLPEGARAIAVALMSDSPTMRRLAEMGLVPGTEIELVRRAPLGDPLQLRLRGSALTIRRRDAKEVRVQCERLRSAATPTAARPR